MTKAELIEALKTAEAERDNWRKAYDQAMEMHALAEKESAEEYQRSRELRERYAKCSGLLCSLVNENNRLHRKRART